MSEFTNIQFSPIQQKAVSFTGGLNEAVNNLELKPGELLACKNYVEIDGAYSGYRVTEGYERYDGSTAPSDTAVSLYQDRGINDSTEFLIESSSAGITGTEEDFTILNLADTDATVINGEIRLDTTRAKFDSFSYRARDTYPGDAAVPTQITTSAESYFALNKDWTIDLTLNIASLAADTNICIVQDIFSFAVYIDSGSLFIAVGDAGYVVPDIVFNVWNTYRISFDYSELTAYIFRDGTLLSTINPSTISINSPVQFKLLYDQQDSNYNVWVDNFRYSSEILSTNDYIVPDVPFSSSDYLVTTTNDSARELVRDGISVVPGDDTADIVGIHSYKNEIYAVRATSTVDKLYKENNGTWVEITPDGTLPTTPLANSDSYHFVNARFEEFNNEEYFFFVNSVGAPCYCDGTKYYEIDATELTDVSSVVGGATNIIAFENRLVYIFPRGNYVMSEVGYATTFAGAVAGTVDGEIVDVKNGPGSTLIFFLDEGIRVISGGDNIIFPQSDYNRSSVCIADTARRSLSDTYFVTNSGLTSFTATDAYGDFEEGILSKKVQRTLLSKLDFITASAMKKKSNQYRLFFNDSTAIYFTFKDKRVKGATIIELDHVVNCITRDSEDNLYFGSVGDRGAGTPEDPLVPGGYVYKMDSGTSFDGEDITASFTSSYHSYGSPRHWKRFRSILFEITAPPFTEIAVTPRYDYNGKDLPDATEEARLFLGSGGIWGISLWGSFIWGSAASVENPMFYTRGRGVNMGVEVSYSSKYLEPHTVHNIITDYTINKRKQ
jgi:hypothetical protein